MTQTLSTTDDTVLDFLIEEFGLCLEEKIEKFEKLTLLATIAANLCQQELHREIGEAKESMYETYMGLPHYCTASDEVEKFIPELSNLCEDDLLGLCESIVAQLRYST
ncbi:MAG: hypothetical protein LDL41_22255 [Coleofasciculus sp. S288]|nr:hypothetical protein [Coleofasciculus sp. S288]